MAQVSLYYRTQLETKVSLLPEQITGDMDKYLLKNLKVKTEGKTNESGIVLRVNKLIDYGDGIIDKINFMGVTVFPVIYECFICSPTKDLEIICVIENIVKGFLIAKNGPVIVAIQYNNIDSKKFEIRNNEVTVIKTKEAIKKGDFIKVSIININSNYGEKHIVTMCKLLNLASKDEIKIFEDDQTIVSGNNRDDEGEFF